MSTLGLSVNNPSLNAALVGNPRVITIDNSGKVTANNGACPTSGSASITSIVCTGCGTILAGQSCQVTITPSNTPSATPGDTSPTPITLSISGTNTNPLTLTINVLTYGSVYQGGYIYAVDDTTLDTGSIGGSVVTLTNQAPLNPNGVVWSSNGLNNTSVSYDSIPGIAQTSTTGSSVPTYLDAENLFNITYSNEIAFPFPPLNSFSSCDGGTDGACNSTNILTLYNAYVTHYGIGGPTYTLSAGPTTTSYYAAGRCTGTISDYSDWYLPAICEMGPAYNGSGCLAGTQNIVSQLPGLLGNPLGNPNTSCAYGANCLTGFYWSSTEVSSSSNQLAWYEDFEWNSASIQVQGYKIDPLAVRCSRALTP